MKTASLVASLLLAATNAAAVDAAKPQFATRAGIAKQEPSTPAQLNSLNVQGCFDDFGELEFKGTPDYNSKSKCAELTCKAAGYAVAATSGGNECYCGKKYPANKSRVDDKNCNVGCSGYDIEACGGIGFWTVYNTGLTLNVVASGDPPKVKAGNDSTPATTTAPGSTVIVTEPSDSENKSGANVGAIAGGVVVAVVVFASSITGFFFYMRRKRNREIEEEHRRNAAVNSFISGKAPSSSGMSITDARLDPVMAQRRLSDGSIADNQDYSRKILRVTNA